MLTTVHTPAIVDTGQRHHATGEIVRKPVCIDSYCKNMGLWIKQTCKLA